MAELYQGPGLSSPDCHNRAEPRVVDRRRSQLLPEQVRDLRARPPARYKGDVCIRPACSAMRGLGRTTPSSTSRLGAASPSTRPKDGCGSSATGAAAGTSRHSRNAGKRSRSASAASVVRTSECRRATSVSRVWPSGLELIRIRHTAAAGVRCLALRSTLRTRRRQAAVCRRRGYRRRCRSRHRPRPHHWSGAVTRHYFHHCHSRPHHRDGCGPDRRNARCARLQPTRSRRRAATQRPADHHRPREAPQRRRAERSPDHDGPASLAVPHDHGWTEFDGTAAIHATGVLIAGANRWLAPIRRAFATPSGKSRTPATRADFCSRLRRAIVGGAAGSCPCSITTGNSAPCTCRPRNVSRSKWPYMRNPNDARWKVSSPSSRPHGEMQKRSPQFPTTSSRHRNCTSDARRA